mmetsp:Transcript_18360/g.59191  ORF Transcript_18360/g.59191 Transcript_18360/m.59191 type:complete len:243 (-) Transcript_18360:128-856(-)
MRFADVEHFSSVRRLVRRPSISLTLDFTVVSSSIRVAVGGFAVSFCSSARSFRRWVARFAGAIEDVSSLPRPSIALTMSFTEVRSSRRATAGAIVLSRGSSARGFRRSVACFARGFDHSSSFPVRRSFLGSSTLSIPIFREILPSPRAAAGGIVLLFLLSAKNFRSARSITSASSFVSANFSLTIIWQMNMRSRPDAGMALNFGGRRRAVGTMGDDVGTVVRRSFGRRCASLAASLDWGEEG